MKGHITDFEAAPVEVDRLRGPALKVGAHQTKIFLTESTSARRVRQSTVTMLCNGASGYNLRNSLICDRAVIDVVNASLELVQTKEHASTSWKHNMVWILEVVFGSPASRLSTPIIGKIRAFGEQEQPHGVHIRPSIRINLALLEFVETVGQAGLIRGHLS